MIRTGKAVVTPVVGKLNKVRKKLNFGAEHDWSSLFRFKGSVVPRVLPTVIIMTMLSALLSLLFFFGGLNLRLPNTVAPLLSSIIGLLLVFRTNQAMTQFLEGSRNWRQLINTARNFARLVHTNGPEETPSEALQKRTAIRLAVAFCVSTKHHLRGEHGCHYEDLLELLPLHLLPSSPPGLPSKPLRKKKKSSKNLFDFVTSSAASLHLMGGGGGNKSKSSNEDLTVPHDPTMTTRSLNGMLNPPPEAFVVVETDAMEMNTIRSDSTNPNQSPIRHRYSYPQSVQESDTAINDQDSLHPDAASVYTRGNKKKVTIAKPVSSTLLRSKKGTLRNDYHGARVRTDGLDCDTRYQCGCVNWPMEVASLMTAYVKKCGKEEKMHFMMVSSLNGFINSMLENYTQLDRILSTPLPTAYAVHMNQTLILYCVYLTFQLLADLSWFGVPLMTLISFILFGIASIGIEIENPFGYDDNDINLDRHCQDLKAEVEMYFLNRKPHSPDDWVEWDHVTEVIQNDSDSDSEHDHKKGSGTSAPHIPPNMAEWELSGRDHPLQPPPDILVRSSSGNIVTAAATTSGKKGASNRPTSPIVSPSKKQKKWFYGTTRSARELMEMEKNRQQQQRQQNVDGNNPMSPTSTVMSGSSGTSQILTNARSMQWNAGRGSDHETTTGSSLAEVAVDERYGGAKELAELFVRSEDSLTSSRDNLVPK